MAEHDQTKGACYAILLAGLAVRLFIAVTVTGYDVDVNTFKAWSDALVVHGISGFYGQGMFADYPPGYMYVLYIVGSLRRLMDLPFDSASFLLILKSPAILADAVSAYLLYTLAKPYVSPKLSLILAALYMFSPAVLVNSAAWGQVDSFFMVWMLLFLRETVRGDMPRASIYYAIALLVKPQALLFGPLILFVFIRRKNWKLLLHSLLYGLLTCLLLSLPFTFKQGPLWIFSLYFNTLASYPYASLNAYNLMTLFGGNFIASTERMFILSYQTWGILLMVGAYVYAGYVYFKSRDDGKTIVPIAFFIITAVFMVMTKMHERYLFYSLLLGLMSVAYYKDKRLLHIYAGLTVTNFINVGQVLTGSFKQMYHIPQWDATLVVVSLANVLLFAYLCRVLWSILVNNRIVSADAAADGAQAQRKPAIPASASSAPDDSAALLRTMERPDDKLHWNKRDTLLVSVLVAVYSVFAFYQLGSLKAPETYWEPTQTGEHFIIDLGSVRTIDALNSYAGIGEGNFKYDYSDDGVSWREPVTIENNVFKTFVWQSVQTVNSTRYIRVTVDKPGFTLYELAIFEQGKDTPMRPHAINRLGLSAESSGTVRNVFDEQETAVKQPTFMNGTYFDEIYHARTAFEHLHRIEPYESTHPPLGKIMISLGIYLFGMNPFGWRVVGTVVGIAMIPIMYVFGKRLFRKTEYAFVAAFLMTFDCMHFVQTRIATIDVYGVFFIMLMFYFMYRYRTMNFYAVPFRKTLLYLALSGIFFGMGAAAKWISVYAGLGLALLFFSALFERYREYRLATRVLHQGKHAKDKKELAEHCRRMTSVFPKYAGWTIVWAVLFFVLVPAIIYTMSYIPFMMVEGPGHGLKDVLTYQKHMFDYHKNLVAEHPFSSQWYQWPMMAKPVWYYGGSHLPPDTISSIVAIGNPLVWWTGFAAVLAAIYLAYRQKTGVLIFIAVAYLSQYVPWMLVPRLTFIYHYFAMVPFIILAVTYFYKEMKQNAVIHRYYLYAYLAAVFGLFLMFYPVLSGMMVSRTYAEMFIRWFPQWIMF